ncbi:hypothetical protein ATER59S_02376 [Aquamicrobium terrae]
MLRTKPETTIGITAARRKLAAIDKRIDRVRDELLRRAGKFDRMSAYEWQRARDGYPGLQGIELALFLRRADACDVLNAILAKQALADERRAAREFRKSISKSYCPECGSLLEAASGASS